jgi:hypothetical protein
MQAGVGRRVGRVRAPPTAAASDAASSSASPVRQVLTGVVSGIYKMAATNQQTDPRLPPLWQVGRRRAGAGAAATAGRARCLLRLFAKQRRGGAAPAACIACQPHSR